MAGILRAELSAAALRHNVAAVRAAIGPEVELCAVVKADAYGHGLAEIVPTLGPLVDRLAVTLPPSALRLRALGWSGPVLTFFHAAGSAPRAELLETLEEQIRSGITLTVTSREDLELLERVAERAGRPVDAHLKIDTGMTRSGVVAGRANALWRAFGDFPRVRATGLYSQLASADAADLGSARAQLATLQAVLGEAEGVSAATVHTANSAATIALPESHLRMVRPGLAIFGCYPSPEMERHLDLRPVLRVTAQLLEVKAAPAGSRTGYGGTHLFAENTPIGLVPMGYADGYPRRLGGRSTMRIRGIDVPVCGRVSMDQVVVDLTAAPGAAVGDPIEIISNDPEAPHSLENLALLADTVPYEICCGLGHRVERRLVED